MERAGSGLRLLPLQRAREASVLQPGRAALRMSGGRALPWEWRGPGKPESQRLGGSGAASGSEQPRVRVSRRGSGAAEAVARPLRAAAVWAAVGIPCWQLGLRGPCGGHAFSLVLRLL